MPESLRLVPLSERNLGISKQELASAASESIIQLKRGFVENIQRGDRMDFELHFGHVLQLHAVGELEEGSDYRNRLVKGARNPRYLEGMTLWVEECAQALEQPENIFSREDKKPILQLMQELEQVSKICGINEAPQFSNNELNPDSRKVIVDTWQAVWPDVQAIFDKHLRPQSSAAPTISAAPAAEKATQARAVQDGVVTTPPLEQPPVEQASQPAQLTPDAAIGFLSRNIADNTPQEIIQAVKRLLQPDAIGLEQSSQAVMQARTFLSGDGRRAEIENLQNELVVQLAEALNTNQPLLGDAGEILNVAAVLGLDISPGFRRLNAESNGTVAKKFFDEMVALARRLQEGEHDVEPQLFKLAFAGEALLDMGDENYNRLTERALGNAKRKSFLPAWQKLILPSSNEITQKVESLTGKDLAKLPAIEVLALIDEKKLTVGQLTDMIIQDEKRIDIRKRAQGAVNTLLADFMTNPRSAGSHIINELIATMAHEGVEESDLPEVTLVIEEMLVKIAVKYKKDISAENLNFDSDTLEAWERSIKPSKWVNTSWLADKLGTISRAEASSDLTRFRNLRSFLQATIRGIDYTTNPPSYKLAKAGVRTTSAEPADPAATAAETLTVNSYELPSLDLLNPPAPEVKQDTSERARILEETLEYFGVNASVVDASVGPTVTQFGIEPGWTIKYRDVQEHDEYGKIKLDTQGNPIIHQEEVSRVRVRAEEITDLANNLAISLAVPSVRIEAPIPGKAIIGIEVPNPIPSTVSLREILESPSFARLRERSKLAVALGKNVYGVSVMLDLTRMPHLLIAGSTGSGNSTLIHDVIDSLLMTNTPDDLRLLLIDPKRTEFQPYEGIPHLLAPVITEPEDAVGALTFLLQEMDKRYKAFSETGVRNIDDYNRKHGATEQLPYYVAVIDELADLMMVNPYDVEKSLIRLAQLARATGIHLVAGTGRPEVDVVTGLIKANFHSRIALATYTQNESETILNASGAENLLGRGDMLFQPIDASRPRRVQGAFVSNQEIEKITTHWKDGRWSNLRPIQFEQEIRDLRDKTENPSESGAPDKLLDKARMIAAETKKLSTSTFQRRLKIGYERAARLVEALKDEGDFEDNE